MGGPNAPDRQMSHLVEETGIMPTVTSSFVEGMTLVVREVSMWCSSVLLGAIAEKLLHGSNK